jgi:hypothetical protein
LCALSDDLRLNSIDRFRKQSSRLILEEYSSCEVPAGCGGVVLRWSPRDGGIPVSIRVAHFGETELRCGGELRTNGRFQLPFGASVLTLHLTARQGAFDWLLVSARHFSASWRADRRQIPELSTIDDGQWKMTTTAPPDDWTATDFDDSDWQPMARSRMPLDALEQREQWQFRTEEDAIGLALPPPNTADEVWIRKPYQLHFEA